MNQNAGTCYQCAADCADCDPDNTALCRTCLDPMQRPSLDFMMCNPCTVAGCSNCDADGKCVQC